MNKGFTPRSQGQCFPAPMINRIMTYRVAAAAFAASVLIAAPAAADPVRGAIVSLQRELGVNTSLRVDISQNDRYGPNDRRGQRLNQWGQSDREVSRLSRAALEACRRAVTQEAYRVGYRDVDFDDDRRVRQTGAYRFNIRYDDVEFEGRRRAVESNVSCTVRRGNVAAVRGVPLQGRDGKKDKHGRADNDRYRY